MARCCRVEAEPEFYILLAAALLAVPVPWVTGWLIAALVHELFHLTVMRVWGIVLIGVRLTPWGARIQMRDLTPLEDLTISFAGPIGGLLCILTAKWLPRTAICGAAQSIYNLIPIYPLDGGRVLRSIFMLCNLEHHWMRFNKILCWIIPGMIVLCGFRIGCRTTIGLMGVIMGISLRIRAKT